MSRIIFLAIILSFAASSKLEAQKHFTRAGKISFFSEAPLEKIEAHNSKTTCVLDIGTGRLEFATLIKAFQFEKALMQEHFNENYMESDKFPKATFKGKIADLKVVDFINDGVYPVTVVGDLTIHGVSNSVETNGVITIKNGEISANSTFEVFVADYKIEIPAVVRDNIAKVVKIDVAVDLKQLKKGS